MTKEERVASIKRHIEKFNAVQEELFDVACQTGDEDDYDTWVGHGQAGAKLDMLLWHAEHREKNG